ncbi:ATP-binding protein [Candidatus Margulisiibacteriota bacterium]
MFSPLMLVIIFIELSISLITSLGTILVANKYRSEGRPQDLYVSFILFAGSISVLGMLFSQLAYHVNHPFAYHGFKGFLYAVVFVAISVWFHLANIYKFRSRALTAFFILIGALGAFFIWISKGNVAFQDGVIIPFGTGREFAIGFVLLSIIVTLDSIFAIIGLSRLSKEEARRFRVSKMAGIFFFFLLLSLFTFVMTKMIYLYVLTWVWGFLAMLFLFLFSMIPSDSPIAENPIHFLRTRILFKLVITIVIMVVISLEGMAFISISISKRALSESVIESYQKVAEDTVQVINTTRIDTSSERGTLRSIAKILETTKIGDRGSVFLISASRKVYINRADQWIGLGEASTPALKKLVFGKSGGGEIDMFGERVVAAYIPIRKLGWGMIVGQPVDYAYARVKQMETTFLASVLFWILLTIVIGIVLSKNIEDPIREMKEGIKKIGAGNLGHKIAVKNIDEIGELAVAFNKMTGELKESQESLLRADRLTSLGYMAAGMAHEIKNALVPLKTLTELLQISGKDEKFIAKFNDMVPHEIDRINRLSTELLHYSKPSEPQFEYSNINEVIDEAVKYLKIQARKKSVELSLDLNSGAKIKLDRQKMLQVFTNLILNAIEAMGDNGGKIWFSSRDEEDHVVVEVTDNGPGIPHDKLSKVFVPFFTSKKEGTGMGLPLVQRVITDHGGQLEVKSAKDHGAMFIIHLPLIKF